MRNNFFYKKLLLFKNLNYDRLTYILSFSTHFQIKPFVLKIYKIICKKGGEI